MIYYFVQSLSFVCIQKLNRMPWKMGSFNCKGISL